MNIAFVISTRTWGGVKTWCLDSAIHINKDKHNSFIYARKGVFTDKSIEQGVKTISSNFGCDFNPRTIAFFVKEFRKNKIDAVVCNISKDIRTAGIAAMLLGIPIYQHVGAYGDLKNRLRTRIGANLLKIKYVTTSEATKKAVLTRCPFLAKKTFESIHPGTEIPKEAPTLNAPESHIVMTSQLHKEKGHIRALNAFAILKKKGLDFSVTIAGTGVLKDQLHKLTKELGLTDRVKWVGFTNDIPSVLKKGSIYLFPSTSEPFGISLQEAFAHGLLCIARNSGGVPEMWPQTSKEFLLSPKADEHEFAESLEKALSLSTANLRKIQQDNHKYFLQNFEIKDRTNALTDWIESTATLQ